MTPLITETATATAGREGRIVADSPRLDLALSVPKELGGAGGEGTNPEQMFAGGYAACFASALALVARRKGVTVGEHTMTGRVSLNKNETGGFALSVELVGKFASLPREQAEALMQEAHMVCPYSNAIRGNVEVALSVAQ